MKQDNLYTPRGRRATVRRDAARVFSRVLPLAVLGLALLLAGCMKRTFEQEETQGEVRISLAWDGNKPASGMRFWFYPQDGGSVLNYAATQDGFIGLLPEGTYRVIVHNSEAAGVYFRGMDSHGTAEACVSEGVRSAFVTRTSALPCIAEPGEVFSASSCREAQTISVRAGGTASYSAVPEALTRQVKLVFDTRSAGTVSSLSGTLGGVSSSVLLCNRSCGMKSCAVTFAAEPAGDGTNYIASVRVFDLITLPEMTPRTNTLDVTVRFGDGSVLTQQQDMTRAIAQIASENGGQIPAELGIDVKLERSAIEGLVVVVTPWNANGNGGGQIPEKP